MSIGSNSVRKKDKKINIILEIVLGALAILMLIPIYYLFVTTFKTPEEATLSPLGLPHIISFENYIKAWNSMNYPRAFMNTFLLTAISVCGIVIITSMAGYALARRKSKLNKVIFIFLLAGIMVPYQVAIITLYKVVIALHLMNKIYGVAIVIMGLNVPMATFLFKNFISAIPIELDEAAMIDGAGVMRTFFTIIFPLLKPIIATVIILDSITIWNDFMMPLLFLSKRENDVILLEVFRNIGQFSTDWTSTFPMMTLGILPLFIFYIFMQKYIIKGVAAGSVKG